MPTIILRIAAAAALCLASGAAGAQQGYDPMAAARGAPALLPGAPSAAAPAAPAVAGHPDYENLPDAAGVEDTYYQCVACHSTAIIKQQRLTDARWDYLWGWMVEEQGMPEAEPETRETILDYLKTHFSSER